MALSILKAKIKNKSYMNFSEFVRDCALVRGAFSSAILVQLQTVSESTC